MQLPERGVVAMDGGEGLPVPTLDQLAEEIDILPALKGEDSPSGRLKSQTENEQG